MAHISNNQYGKANVRLLKLNRAVSPHRILDCNVQITLTGDMEAAFTYGDNSKVVPTDTMKNTVYILAKREMFTSIEEFGTLLVRHFVENYDQIYSAKVMIEQHQWQPVAGTQQYSSSFTLNKSEVLTTDISFDGNELSFASGISGLTLLKSENSGFENYVQDEYTTLKPTDDRILSTTMTAVWSYSDKVVYEQKGDEIRRILLDEFAKHDSKSVQETLYTMGNTVLKNVPELDSIRISMPNEHKILADLSRFNLANENEIFIPTSEPFGVIEATLSRD